MIDDTTAEGIWFLNWELNIEETQILKQCSQQK